MALLDTDPGKVRAKAYDIVLNGMEVGGGSLRIHDSALQAKVFKLLSLTRRGDERALRLLHRGAAVRHAAPRRHRPRPRPARDDLAAGEASLRDVIAFPKTASATDLMSRSPSVVDEDQVRDLGIRTFP